MIRILKEHHYDNGLKAKLSGVDIYLMNKENNVVAKYNYDNNSISDIQKCADIYLESIDTNKII